MYGSTERKNITSDLLIAYSDQVFFYLLYFLHSFGFSLSYDAYLHCVLANDAKPRPT